MSQRRKGVSLVEFAEMVRRGEMHAHTPTQRALLEELVRKSRARSTLRLKQTRMPGSLQGKRVNMIIIDESHHLK